MTSRAPARAPLPAEAPSRPILGEGPIGGIDGLRAICVGIVLFAHYGFERIVPGGLGVTAFFFLSGFLITTLLLRERAQTGDVRVGRFYARRLLRLHPELLAFVVVAGFVLYRHKAPLMDTAAAVFYFTNYHQIFGAPGAGEAGFRFPHLWSLAVEEHYYITYPLLFALLGRARRRVWPVLAGICVVSLALRQLYHSLGWPASHAYQATETRIDSIAYGCLAALLLWHAGGRVARALGGRRGWGPLLAGLALLLVTLVYREAWFRDTLRYSLQGLAFMAIMVSLQASAIGPSLRGALDVAPLRWMGRMSYAAYLWHLEPEYVLSRFVDFAALRATLPGQVLAALMLGAATFAVAYLSHVLIYRNFLGLRHRFGSHAS